MVTTTPSRFQFSAENLLVCDNLQCCGLVVPGSRCHVSCYVYLKETMCDYCDYSFTYILTISCSLQV